MSDDLLKRLKEKSVQPRFSESLTMKIFKQLASIETALANGYTGKQIAEELGIEQALFYSALHRARKKASKIAAAGGLTKNNQSQKTAPPKQAQPVLAATVNHQQEQQTEGGEEPEELEFDLTTPEGRRAAQASKFKKK